MFCKDHKHPDMIDVITKKCEFDGCEKIPAYNHKGKKRGIFCLEHKHPDMIDVITKKCEFDGCDKIPAFNHSGQKRGVFCVEHKHPDMVNVISKTCEFDGCHKQPAYNHSGNTKGIFCKDHKHPDMIDVRNRTCEFDGCEKIPAYNHRGNTKGIFCLEHKHPDMVDVKSKKCEFDGCHKQPAYNHIGNTKGIFCKDHKHPDMVDVISKRCEFDGCEKQPAYNHRGERKGLLCADHKHPDMVDVVSRTCEFDGCEKQPVYNHRGERKGLFCNEHKHPTMVNVKNKRCEFDGCETQVRYGHPGHYPTRCAQHMTEGMISKPRTKCVEHRCDEIALYGIHRALHCIVHMTPDERNLVGQKCTYCSFIDILDEKGLCDTCRPDTIAKVRLGKQREVKMFLDRNGLGDYQLYDRVIDGGQCGKERPDFMWECGTHCVVLEVDEDGGHKSYNEVCECTRMINISQSLGCPTVFIRYNPDTFIVNGRHKDFGVAERVKTLIGWIHHVRNTRPSAFLSMLQLYYDGYKKGSEKMIDLVPFVGP